MKPPFLRARSQRSFWLVVSILIFRAAFAADSNQELRPPHGELSATFWELHGWQVVCGSLAFVILAALFVIWLRLPKPVAVEAPALTARRALEALRNRAVDDALAVDVSGILRRYLWAAFQFPQGELTTAEVHRVLQTHRRINPNLAADIGNFLRRCDEWKFAPAPPASQPAMAQDALDLLEKIERALQPVPAQKTAVAHAA